MRKNSIQTSKNTTANLNLRTAMKRKKKGKEPSATAALNQVCQTFGVIVSKSISKQNAFAYQITYVSFNVATPDGEIRQSNKCS